MIIKYNRRSTWTGDGVGMQVNDIPGVAIEGVKAAVVDEFAGMSVLNLKIGGRSYGNFNLAGTQKGLDKMLKCIDEVENGSISLDDIAGEYEADNGEAPQPKKDDGGHRGKKTVGGADDNAPNEEQETTYSSGTGFFVNGDGYLLTNAHVVEGCEDATVRLNNADVEPATILARETTNDLAILKVDRRNTAFGTFRGAPQIRLGDSIVVFGFPLTDFLSKTGNLSTGLVSSLAGASDDVTQLQISAPVQSGNSGGAVVDQSGHVVGIVVAKSNLQSHETDDDIEVIQNVNFAIKAGMAQFFLDAHQVRYEVEPPGDDLKTPDVASIARNFSAQVMCEVKE